MGKKNRHLRQKKRKALKAQKKNKKSIDHRSEQFPLPYTGNKYRTKELIPLHMCTETGIYEAFVMSDRQLTDADVRSALQRLILQIRANSLPPLETCNDDTPDTYTDIGNDQDLLTWNIRRNWQHLFQTQSHPGRDKLVGVLRTILGSIDVRGSIARDSRGYLFFIEEFLNDIGVHVEVCSSEEEMLRIPQ